MLISIDWGTTNARAWLVENDGTVRLRASSKAGMADLSESDFAPALEALVGVWRQDHADVPVLISGMAGAKGGWREAGYVSCPFDADALAAGLVEVAKGVSIVPGAKVLRSVGSQPVRDVMRGEEVQSLGALDEARRLTQLCLPGTHSKWIDVIAGRADRFTTYMTGELFALLSSESLLARSVGQPIERPFGQAFEDGVAVGRDTPLAAALFGVRTRDVAAGLPAHQNRAYLSGLLIGHELAGATETSRQALSPRVGICGEPRLVALYERALRLLEIDSVVIDAERATVRGHLAVARAAGLFEGTAA